MDEESDAPDKETGRRGEEANSSGQASSVDLTAYTRGAWKGSDVKQAKIDWLYRSRRIPEEVFCRIPGKELEPAPEPGEVVVFAAHFERGFGLPASDFFWRFLGFYKLQPHHLPANAIFYLSSYVSFMEGFVGLLPTIDTFARFYNLRTNSVQDKKLPLPKPMVQCGACILTPRQGSTFYKFSGLESCRAWQQTFFYVRNSGATDFINLPAYVPGIPSKANWKFNPKEGHEETNRIVRYIEELNEKTGICSDDIVRVFVSRRVLPLQRRVHKIGQMSCRRDPTRITTFGLHKLDVVLKARQICRTTMPVDWKWGLQPLSRKKPLPPRVQRCFPRFAAEEPASFDPKRSFLDDADPDPYILGNVHKMAPTHSRRPGNFSTQNPANASDTDDDEVVVLEVMEHVTPLAAEVGDPPVRRTRKAPASDAGTSEPPAPKRQKKGSAGPAGRKRKHDIPVSSGAALVLTRSAPGMRPETAEDTGRATPPPHPSPARSGAGKAPSSPRGGKTSSGRAAPKKKHLRTEEDTSSPPEHEDTGANNMGAGSEETVRPEPLVPSAPEKTPQTPAASPSKTSSPAPPPTSSPAKDAPAPPPASVSKPPPAPRKGSRTGTEVNAEQLSSVVAATTAPASGSQAQALILHTGRAAVTANEKVSAQLGRIVELNRGETNLGSLQEYVDKWNLADLSVATLGVGKDKQLVVDTRVPRNTVQHLGRLKHAMREFDNAWHDANANVLSTLDSRKQLFEELLWEHRDLVEAFAALKLTHSACQAALPEASLEDLAGQIAALKAEKEELTLQHSRDLEAQRNDAAKLKDQLIQAGLQHVRALKEAIAAGDAKVEEARKQFAEAEGQLRAKLEEETGLLH
ncbi:hypothetical protein ACQ4PT_020399 [Festuca glaucescens]